MVSPGAPAWEPFDFTCTSGAALPDLRRHRSGLLTRDAALRAARDLTTFVAGLPKAELHVHIDGTMTPARAFDIAKRNQLPNYETTFDAVLGASRRKPFDGSYTPLEYAPNEPALNAFLTELSRCSAVYRTEQDFYHVMLDYLKRAAENGIVRAEIMFDGQSYCFKDASGCACDPQTRDLHAIGEPLLSIDVVLSGFARAMADGKELYGVDSSLILSILMDRSTEEAEAMLQLCLASPHRSLLVAITMSNSTGPWGPNSTHRFASVWATARAAGLHCQAHAGEVEGADNVDMALEVLGCDRIDHGVRCLESPAVVTKLRDCQVPLTVCPISNHRMQLYPRFFAGENPVRALMDAGLKVTLNSDDPAYFMIGECDQHSYPVTPDALDGFLCSNYMCTAQDCGLSPDEVVTLAKNSIEGAFCTTAEKKRYMDLLARYCADPTRWGPPKITHAPNH